MTPVLCGYYTCQTKPRHRACSSTVVHVLFSREPIPSLGLQPIYLSTSDWGGSSSFCIFSCFFLSILIFSLLFNNHTKTQKAVINLFLSTTWEKNDSTLPYEQRTCSEIIKNLSSGNTTQKRHSAAPAPHPVPASSLCSSGHTSCT